MLVTKLYRANSFAVIFNRDLLFMLLAYFQEAHVDKRLKHYLTLHFIHSHGQFYNESIFANHFDNLSLIF